MSGLTWSKFEWAGGVIFPPAPVAFPATYVHPQGSNEAPYGTWETAAHSIQDALTAAGANGNVVIYPGSYTGNIATMAANQKVMAYQGADTEPGVTVFRHGAVEVRGVAGADVDVCAVTHSGVKMYGLGFSGAQGVRRSLNVSGANFYSEALTVSPDTGKTLLHTGSSGVYERLKATSAGQSAQSNTIEFYGPSGSAVFRSGWFGQQRQISVSNGTSWRFHNCNFAESRERIFNFGAGVAAATLELTNCLFEAMSLGSVSAVPINCGDGVTVAAKNTSFLANGFAPASTVYKSGNGTIDATAGVYSAPGFVSPRYPQSGIGFSFDCTYASNMGYAYETAAVAEQYGFKISAFVQTKGSNDYTTETWNKVKELLARGHDIGLHSRWHPHLGSPSGEGLGLRYTGSGSVATATIANNTLTVTVDGSVLTTQDLTGIVSGNPRSVNNLAVALNNVIGLAAQVYTSSYAGNARAFCLADATSISIASGTVVSFPLDVNKLLDEEITGSRQDIYDKTGVWVTSMSYPHDSFNDAVLAGVLARGLKVSRGGIWTGANASHTLASINMGKILGPWLTQLSPADSFWQIDTAEKNKRGAASFFTALAAIGGYANIYAHSPTEVPPSVWPDIFEQANLAGLKPMHLAGFGEYIHNSANGWTSADGITFINSNLAQAQDYRLASSSPFIGVGSTDTTATRDFNGQMFPGTPPIGAFNAAG